MEVVVGRRRWMSEDEQREGGERRERVGKENRAREKGENDCFLFCFFVARLFVCVLHFVESL